jgi:hypothetical protein
MSMILSPSVHKLEAILTSYKDNFDGVNGSGVDLTKWTVQDAPASGNTLLHDGTDLVDTMLNANGADTVILLSKATLLDNFNVELKVNRSGNNATNRYMMGIAIVKEDGSGHIGIRNHLYSTSRQIVIDENSWGDWKTYSSHASPEPLTFRISRTGATAWTLQAWKGSSWYTVNRTYNLGTGPYRMQIRIYKDGSYPDITTKLSSLELLSGTIVIPI